MKYKYNGQWVEVTLKAFEGMPIGSIIEFAGTVIPTGWLECDGRSLSEEVYPQLYDVIGYTYGGSGLSFNLPNFKGRVPVGQDTNDTDFNVLGETGGEKTHTLTIDEMPSHNHLQALGGSITTTDQVAGACVVGKENSSYTQNTGGGQAHNNLPPYITTKFIIKATQTTPTFASIVNAESNSTTDSYSCDYINKLHKYSTTEQVVGTWIDGKPIYRKVIVDTTSRGAGNYSIAHNISNLSDITHIETLCWQNSTTMFNGTSTTPLSGSERVTSYLNGANISIRNSWESVKVIIIIEYTKTTD